MQKTVARLNLGEDEDTAHADQVMSGRTRLGIVARLVPWQNRWPAL